MWPAEKSPNKQRSPGGLLSNRRAPQTAAGNVGKPVPRPAVDEMWAKGQKPNVTKNRKSHQNPQVTTSWDGGSHGLLSEQRRLKGRLTPSPDSRIHGQLPHDHLTASPPHRLTASPPHIVPTPRTSSRKPTIGIPNPHPTQPKAPQLNLQPETQTQGTGVVNHRESEQAKHTQKKRSQTAQTKPTHQPNQPEISNPTTIEIPTPFSPPTAAFRQINSDHRRTSEGISSLERQLLREALGKQDSSLHTISNTQHGGSGGLTLGSMNSGTPKSTAFRRMT